MSFKETIFFMLSNRKKSIQTELNNFFENVLKQDKPISKQAFLEARNKIHPKAFGKNCSIYFSLIDADKTTRFHGWS